MLVVFGAVVRKLRANDIYAMMFIFESGGSFQETFTGCIASTP